MENNIKISNCIVGQLHTGTGDNLPRENKEIICEIRYKSATESTVTVRYPGEEPIHVSQHNSSYCAVMKMVDKLVETLKKDGIHDGGLNKIDWAIYEYSFYVKEGDK